MPCKQRMRIANEKMSKNVGNRGNVPENIESSGGKIPRRPGVISAILVRCMWITVFQIIQSIRMT